MNQFTVMRLAHSALLASAVAAAVAGCHPGPGPGSRLIALDSETFPAVLRAIVHEVDSSESSRGDSLPVRVVALPLKSGVEMRADLPNALMALTDRELAYRRAAIRDLMLSEGPAYGPPSRCAGPLVPPAPDGSMPDRSGCPRQRSLTVALSFPYLRSTTDTTVVEAWLHGSGPGGSILEGREYVLARAGSGSPWSVLRYVLQWIVE